MDWEDILYGIFFGIVKLIYYVFPVAFIAGGIALGVTLGKNVKDNKVSSWANEQYHLYSHEVTIDWCMGSAPSSITVMENQPWTVDGYCWGTGLYASDSSYTYESYIKYIPTDHKCEPRVPTRSGYVFLGLYTSEVGGVQYTNAAGYGIRVVISDIKLYALWQEAE